GGIGIRSLGGQTYGGKHYIYIFAAAVGYFAISCQRISAEHVPRALRLFYFGALTHPISNLIYIAGPAFYWLFRMFPVEFAVQQAITESAMSRFNAVTFAMMGVYSWMMARFGIAGIFDWRRPWRLAFWLGVVVVSLLGGFRSVVIYLALVFVFQFVLEGLLRTRLFPLLVMGTALVFAALVPVAPKLPFALQRALSFLPIEVSPLAKADAIASTDWRLRMWKVVWPDVPKYLWLGKGYVINPTDLYLVVESQKRGLAADIDEAVIAGDYHSGPFSVLIPFGIPGTVAFTLFCLAALRVLWRNYRHGDAALRTLNTFLLACFAAKFVFFWALFGALASDLAQFAGMAAFSVALNGGVRTARIPAATPQHAPKEGTLEPAPTTG
ncbi:MAG: hypothetical protein HY300_20200, partial [Verrucomicrobia bacterium]|nr:hypothetical protein [Verrucomicrobiota bacterium]